MILDAIAGIAERKIQEAREEGAFDNLPGKGQPLNLDEDFSLPFEVRMMSKVLKNANVLPEWIQIRKDIDTEKEEIAKLREKLTRENRRWTAKLASVFADSPSLRAYALWFERSRALYLNRLKSMNTTILKFKLTAPSSAEPMFSYKIDFEMGNFDSEFPYRTQSEA